MSGFEILTVLAMLIAPLLAVQVQKWLETYRSQRDRRIDIYKTLMATRATGISPEHVKALNLIDLEFNAKSHKPIRESWKAYLDHLNDMPRGEDKEAQRSVWDAKIPDLLAALLHEMGTALGYKFDTVHIKKSCYLPEGHTKMETEQSLVRQRLLQVLFGEANLKMDISSLPVDPEALENQKMLTASLLAALKESGGKLPVETYKNKSSGSGA